MACAKTDGLKNAPKTAKTSTLSLVPMTTRPFIIKPFDVYIKNLIRSCYKKKCHEKYPKLP